MSVNPLPPEDERIGTEDGAARVEPEKTAKPRVLPFSNGWPLAVGALTGIVLRLIFFGRPGGAWSAMDAAFYRRRAMSAR